MPEQESYSVCEDCHKNLNEDEVYGEWADLCKGCYIERKDNNEEL